MEYLTNCPICGKTNFIKYITCKDFSISKENFTVEKCTRCNFLLTNPRPEKENIGTYYNSTVYISHNANKTGLIPWLYRIIRNIQFRNKTNLIKNYVKENFKILDIGCGTGDFLHYCSKLGWITSGVEPDKNARLKAQTNTSDIFDLSYLETTKEKYNIITMWHVLEHVHDLPQRLNQLLNLLDEKGILFIAVPNPNSYDANHYKQFWAAYDLPRHLSHFTIETITNLFNLYNFKLVQIEPMKYDSYYVSLKSEEYKSRNIFSNLPLGLIHGIISNIKASKTNEYSSLIYVFKK